MAMKESGIEWVGLIPDDWKIPQVRNFFKINRGRVIAKTEINELYKEGLFPVYSSQTKDNGCMGYIDSYDFEKEGLTWTTDGAYAGTVFYRKGKYNCTNVCGILTLKDGFDASVPFCKYSIGWSAMNCRRADINGYKIMSNEMAAIKFVMPPLFEQQAIANYLDETCSKIDEIIAEAKASIDEYKELKQSVIFEAVTKGLDKNVEMKDSGVEGMGFIPAKWPVVRFMKVNYVRARLGWKGLKAEEYVDVGYPFLAAYHIVNGHLCWENLNCITKERYDESPEIKLSIGDLVLVKDGAGIGKCARIDDMPLGEATVNSSLSVITPNKLLDYRYEYYYFMSPLFQNIIARLKNGMGVPHLTQESMKDIYLPLPSKNEQQAIADYLDNKMIGLDSLIAEKESLINDLEAYKKSLIYEVVTGKRRVV